MLKPAAKKTVHLALCAMFTALIAVSAFLQIPIPLMDYFTLQFLFVLLAGMLLGPAWGAASVALYLALGLTGIPIFAAGGGIHYVLRPSFGYLLGFLVTAFVVGLCRQRLRRHTVPRYFGIALIGMLITYLIGFTYKYLILNLYLHEATSVWAIVLASLSIDIPGDVALCLIAAGITPRLRRVMRREVAA